MPELPEVEILARHLRPLLVGRRVKAVEVLRKKAIRPMEAEPFAERIRGAEIQSVGRRAKYLSFGLSVGRGGAARVMLGHLGMTGRMYVVPAGRAKAPHVSVVFALGPTEWVFEDCRQFGGLTWDQGRLEDLGPEPLAEDFTVSVLATRLGPSGQAIKVRLMDQSVLAGLGNIYASEALHWAKIAPDRPAGSLKRVELGGLHEAIRTVLESAIRLGESVPLDFAGEADRDALFYYGSAERSSPAIDERFRVYDRAGQPCPQCSQPIEKVVLGGRSTYFCRRCQR